MGVTVLLAAVLLIVLLTAGGCGSEGGDSSQADVVVSTTHLAEIAANIAGDRLTVQGLIPAGADPHSFEPTPATARLIGQSRVIIVDVFGLVPVLDELIQTSAGAGQLVVEAAAGLPARMLGESGHSDDSAAGAAEPASHEGEADPHFWLDPVNVMGYVENIVAAFTAVDPEGASTFAANAAAYTEELRELDAWIVEQVSQIPADRRLLVTDHESFGYFADRYGFTVVGTVLGAGSSGGSPSAQELATLVAAVKASGVPAVFVETGSNADLASQVAREAGVEVVTDLYTHSVGEGALTYIEMMRHNVTRLVQALR